MAANQPYPTRNYAVGERLLTLRSRAKLTQSQLAQRIGINRRSVQKWESGESYPTAENLRALIALLLSLGVFTQDREYDEAAALWQQISQDSPQHLPLFDFTWFEQLLAARTASGIDAPRSPTASPTPSSANTLLPAAASRGFPQPVQRDPSAVTHLPFQPTPFIGREAELTEIVRVLNDPACRLLTLVGPGGIGKTRLALEAARQIEAFADGVVFVALASVGNPNQIVSALADALNLSFPGVLPPEHNLTTHVLDYLRRRHLLLILDSFEHLLAGSDLVNDILQKTPRVTLLITSHERLNLQAEWLFDVKGLSYPPVDDRGWVTPPVVADLTGYGAVQLFVQRARQVQPEFPLSQAVLMSIVQICQQVAGMPLALELAAASVRMLSIGEIERQIRSNLDAFSTPFRDVPVRHRSLRAVFDHSWNLLSESERAILSRLAIFRGGWEPAAAEAISANVTEQAGLSYPFFPGILASLVEKSLVRLDYLERPVPGERSMPPYDGELRYFMLEPIREYAMEQLAARGEAEVLRKAHAAYYLALAEKAAAQWDNPTADAAIEQLDRERDNLRAALQRSLDRGHQTTGLRLAGALRKFWRRRGAIPEGRAWLEAFLALNGGRAGTDEMAVRLRAMQEAASLASDQHDFTQATQLFEQSLSLRRALGEPEDDSQLLVNTALEARSAGHYQQAADLLEDVLARQRALGNRGSLSSGGIGRSLFLLGLVRREQGEFARARVLFDECAELHRTLEDREDMAVGLLALSDIARDYGDIAETRRVGEQSLVILRQVGALWAIGFALNNLTLAAYLAGDLTQAQTLIGESVSLFRAQKADASLAEVLVTQGHILRAQGDPAAAYTALAEALRLAQAVGPLLMAAEALEALAILAAQPGQAAFAVRLLGAASALRTRMGTPVRPVHQPLAEQALITARSILGDEAFATMWAAAGALSLEQIVSDIHDSDIHDVGFFAGVALPDAQRIATALPTATAPIGHGPRVDWGLAQDVPVLYGRTQELATLTDWIVEEQCRVVMLVGIGGIGKTSLAITFARQVASHFAAVVFRSLGEMPPLDELLDQLLDTLATEQTTGTLWVPSHLSDKLALLVDLLRQKRCLLILDNLESLRQAGTLDGQYLAGYEAYATLFKLLAETAHQSCLLVTSREKPAELAPLEGPRTPVRSLRVPGLPEEACRALLADQAMTAAAGDAAALARRFDGNPLALKLVAEPIRTLFGGDIAAFLSEGALFFTGVGQLLEQQIGRASVLEQALLLWLAIEREPVALEQLMEDLIYSPDVALVGATSRPVVLAALQALWRRNLIERGQVQLTFTLQRVVMEYLTERLIERAADEIVGGGFDILCCHALIQATAKDYVRHSQERLVAAPLLERLGAVYGAAGGLEQRFLTLLALRRDLPLVEQGYGAGNLVNLLRLLRGHLRGLDLAHQSIRQAYLQGVEMQDTTLAGATIQECVFTETFDALTAVAISRDGEHWAASSGRGEIQLWGPGGSLGRQILLRAWHAHTGSTFALAFSPNGSTLASGSFDGMVKLWDTTTGVLLWSGKHRGHVNCVAFSPDGDMCASSGDDMTVRLWNVRSGEQVQLLSHDKLIIPVAWSPDGHLLATGDIVGHILLWEIQTNQELTCVQTLSGHTTWVDGLAFSPDGSTLASASTDGTVGLWDMTDGTLQRMLRHTERVTRIAWSPDGRLLASGSFDQMTWLWDVEQGRCRTVLRGHTALVTGVVFTPDGHSLLSGSADGTLRVWDVVSGQCLRVLQGYATSLYDVDWSPDGDQLIGAGTDKLVTIFDVIGSTPPRVLGGHSGTVFGVGWSSDGRWLASSEMDNVIQLWDAVSGHSVQTLQYSGEPGNFFSRLAWSPNGQRLAAGTLRHGVQVFEIMAHRQDWPGREFTTWIRPIAWRPDGRRLAGGGDDGTVYLWDEQGTLLQQMPGGHDMITSVAWSPDGTRLASAANSMDGGDLFVWDPEHAEEPLHVFRERPESIHAIVWGPGDAILGDVLISGDANGNLRWWNVSSGESARVRQAHQGKIQALRRSPDGTKLASCGDDGAIMLWDLHSGDHLQTLRRDRPYERMDISGLTGITATQRASLTALGAVDLTDYGNGGSFHR